MYPLEFEYHRAGSVTEAISLLSQHNGAKVLAGGHSLIPAMKLRLADPGILVDIGRISELNGIRPGTGTVSIGGLTTHSTLASSKYLPAGLSEAASMVADVQVRNRGTIGGNVAHADPASDLPPILTALGATFHISSSEGNRKVSAVDFFTGMFETDLDEGEILTAVEVESEQDGIGSAYSKLFNPASGYAMVGVAAVLTIDDGKCTKASVALGGVTPYTTSATSVEAALIGKSMDEVTIASAAATVQDDLGDTVMSDIHAGSDYRREMTTVFVQRALVSAAKRAT